jgi:hypothetical protein
MEIGSIRKRKVMKYQDLTKLGSKQKVREKGK